MRKWCVGLALALTTSGLVVAHAPGTVSAQAVRRAPLDDPRLLAERDDARREHTRRTDRTTAPARVLVEVQTTDTQGVARGLRRIGAEVNGSVPGAAVQALVPVDSLETVAAFGAVTDLQYPRRQGYVPAEPLRRTDVLPQAESGFGPTHGGAVDFTNTAFWQGVGFTGAGVKVGIVDYFRLNLWSTAEQGPKPNAAHQFCQDSFNSGLCASASSIRDSGEIHGNAVAEIVKDMAPGAELFVASVGTVADLRAAIDWFALNGVTVMTRSLGSAYDGAGDGTGPLASAVNYAVGKGIIWFNSAGNEGQDAYMKKTVKATVAVDGGNYVNVNDGSPAVTPAVDTWLRVDSFGCFFMDGVRWASDWYLGANIRTDYSVEFWQPKVGLNTGDFRSHKNPTRAQVDPLNLNTSVFGNQGGGGLGGNILNRSQRAGAAPLEANDIAVCPTRMSNPVNGTHVTYIRINRAATTSIGAVPDRLEVAIAGNAFFEYQYSDRAGSAAKPVVDSKNPGLVSVGAVEANPSLRLVPSDPNGIAWYSSQGPTTDGRTKPDIASWAGNYSWTYATLEPSSGTSFSGTSAAAPAAAGIAALLAGAGLASGPAALAALVKHHTIDHSPLGPDNAYGFGLTNLLDPPERPIEPASAGRYIPVTPTRVLDSRPKPGGPPAYSRALGSIIDVPIGRALNSLTGVNPGAIGAVAVNITSVGSRGIGFVQAYPTNRVPVGATSTLNLNVAGETVANFTIVPVGDAFQISLYMPSGGHVIVDVMGYFTKDEPVVLPVGPIPPPTDGRFVPLPTPTEIHTGVLSTGSTASVSLPLSLPTDLVPAGAASAVVVNLTAWGANRNGFLRAAPSDVDAGLLGPSSLNLSGTGAQVTNTAIVPLGADGAIQIFSKAAPGATATDFLTVTTQLKVDVVGYFTSATVPFSAEGLFLPIAPTRMYDSRKPTPNPVGAGTSRTVTVAGIPNIFGGAGAPAGAIAYSGNWTVTQPASAGTMSLHTGPLSDPRTFNVSYRAGQSVANGALFAATLVPGTPDTSTVNAFMSASGHVIIDVNGYFLAATPP